MKFPRFDMERMQSVWEHKVKYDLSESGVEALTLAEITRDQKELLKTRLGYAEGVGREATRALIAGIHPGHPSLWRGDQNVEAHTTEKADERR